MYKTIWPTSVYSAKSIKFVSFFILFLFFIFHDVWSIVTLTLRCMWSQWTQPKHYGEKKGPWWAHSHVVMGEGCWFFWFTLNHEVEAVEIEPVVEERPTGSGTSCHSHRICGHLVADVSFHKEWLRARNSCSWCIHGSFKKLGTTFFASD